MRRSPLSKQKKLVRISAWIPEKEVKRLMRQLKVSNRSELLRHLVEQENERLQSAKAHQALYGIAKEKDFYI